MSTLTLEQALQQAIAHHRAGELPQAEQLYRAILQVQPNHAEANHNLGVLAVAMNQAELAVPFFKIALDADPNQARFCLSYIDALIESNQLETAKALLAQRRRFALSEAGVLTPSEAEINQFAVLFHQGEHIEAEKCALKLTECFPDSGIAWKALGAVLCQSGRLEESLAAQIKSVALLPNDAEVFYNLGNTLKALGRFDEAEQNYLQAITRNPNYADAYINLGNIFKKLGRLPDAEKNYRHAIAVKPHYAEAHNNLGNTLRELGRLDEAESNYRLAIAINSTYADAYNNLGITLKILGRLVEAESNYRQTIAINPNHAQALNNLGNLLKGRDRLQEAEGYYRSALEVKPHYADAHNNLGILLKDQGRFDEAEQYYRNALDIKPDYIDALTNLLFTYNYTTHHSPEFCLTEAKRYGELVSQKVTQKFTTWQCKPQAERLRVGLVSGDFQEHVVSYFLENLLTQLDTTNIELIAYAAQHKVDNVMTPIKAYFADWKPISALNDKEAARLIHHDGVHILIDLSGHTAYNRLPLFAWKPAPIQVTWLGYFATTGVAEIDYILVDKTGVPENQQWQFVEQVRYLPDTRLCFSAPSVDIAISALPALSKGYITFGCFQNLGKVTDAVLAVWSRILRQLPTARLRFQAKQLRDEQFTKQFYLRLAKQGIETNRISTHAAGSREHYLAAHSEVDVILDTFPYTGGTTTCEALWMGVPTLSLAGDTLIARQGASLLSAASLPDWIAFDLDSYLEKAVAFANDLNALAKLRGELREQVLASPLFDGQRFARNFETILTKMWRDYQA